LKGEETLTQLAERFDVHANQITQWKNQLVAQAAAVFTTDGERRSSGEVPLDVKTLHAKIGQQALEIDFLAGALGQLPGSSAKR
jgi:transposase-like protein